VKYWVDGFWQDFNNDNLNRKLTNFISVDVQAKFPKLAEMMQSSVNKRTNMEREKAKVLSASAPKPILPKGLARKFSDRSSVVMDNMALTSPSKLGTGQYGFLFAATRTYTKAPDVEDYRVKVIDLDPQEIARQLTLMEFQLYERIRVKPT